MSTSSGDCERCHWDCTTFNAVACRVCGCRLWRGYCDGASLHQECRWKVERRLDNLSCGLYDAGLAAAGAQHGADRMIAVATNRLDYYDLYREPGPMQTKPVTFAVLEEVILLMMAAKRRL